MTFMIQAIRHLTDFNFRRSGAWFVALCAVLFINGALAVAAQDGGSDRAALEQAFNAVRLAERDDSGDAPEAVVKPMFALTNTFLEPNGWGNNEFGRDVAVSGDTSAISTYSTSAGTNVGAVYIFKRSSQGAWTFQQKLTALSSTDYGFGLKLALEGDTLAVGASGAQSSPNVFPGVVSIYTRTNSTWTLQQKVAASDFATENYFGFAVALSGETLVVGSPFSDINGNADAGAAYVFVRSGRVWTQQQKIRAADAAANDQFGSSVAIDGNTIVAGAPQDTVGSNQGQGSVYVFNRLGTNWTQQQRVVIADGAVLDLFGISVDLDGANLIVGGGTSGEHPAYVYMRPGASFVLQQKLTPPSVFNYIGYDVAIEGDTAVVGSYKRTVGLNQYQGAAFVFKRAGSAWTNTQQINSPDGGQSDSFGYSVALDGKALFLGMPGKTINGSFAQGAAASYQLVGDEYSPAQTIVANDPQFYAHLGAAMASTADTLVVGAPNIQVAYVFVKDAANAWTLQQKLTSGDFGFGRSVAVHQNSIIVGTNSNVHVFVRTGTQWTLQQAFGPPNMGGVADFGASVAIEDNLAVVGAPTSSAANGNSGRVFYYERSGNGWRYLFQISPTDLTGGDRFGATVALNNRRLVIGAPDHTIATDRFGALYVYEPFINNDVRFAFKQKLFTTNEINSRGLGVSLAVQNELIVAGSGRTGTRGAAYVFAFNITTGNYDLQQRLEAADGAGGDQFGFSVALANDKILVGSPFDDTGASGDHGSAYVFSQNGASWAQTAKLIASDAAAGDFFGESVAFNGESAFVGAPYDTVNGTEAPGSVRLFRAPVFVQKTAFDFDGDGKADLGAFRPSNGGWYLYNLSSGQNSSYAFGQTGDIIVPADYDGDGKTDVAVYRAGTWYLNRSTAGFTGIGFGAATDIPAPADFDGDGKTDLCVFRPSNGGWYIYNLATNANSSVAFGQAGDKPVPADYDGDGKADVAVFRAGVWYLQRSQLGFTGVTFGEATDKVVPADYDGDGKTDVAVFRPSNGTWYLLQSTAGFKGVAFGQNGDALAPADYDGDGRADVAVFRSGNWYIQRSSDGFTGATFGAATDTAIPSAYVR